FENLQFTAAYKERGALNKLLQLGENVKKRGVICASAGNHSQALAYHAARLGIPVTIVMPRTTPFMKVQQTRGHGAEVVLDGESYDDASAHAHKLCEERDLVFVHPFNDPDVMAGQGTVALEMLEDIPELEVLPVPIGGGGLIAGVATAAKSVKPDIRIVGLEPAMYPSFTAKMRGMNAASQIGASTIAEGIAVKTVGDLTYAIARPLIDDVLLLEEPYLERAIALYCNVEQTVAEGAAVRTVGDMPYASARPLTDDVPLLEEPYLERAIALYCNVEKTVAEGAGAASLAGLLAYPEKFRGKKCGLILTGGNIDTRLL